MNSVESMRLHPMIILVRLCTLTIALLSLMAMATPSFAQSANRCFATANNGATVYSSTTSSAVRSAIADANDGATVKIAGYCSGAVAQGTTNQLALITKTLILSGGYTDTNWITPSLTNETILDAAPTASPTTQRVFSMTADVTLERLTIMNGRSNKGGGGISTMQSLTLRDVTVLSNTQSATNLHGGGIYAMGSMTITDGKFENNRNPLGFGGAVQVDGSLIVSGTEFISNTAKTGAAVSVSETATIVSVQFISNTASQEGGALSIQSNGTISQSSFVNNRATNRGGAIAAFGIATIQASQFISNSTSQEGGALYLYVGGTISQSTFSDNRSSTRKGGAIYSLSGPLNLSKSALIRNFASLGGGAVAQFNGESAMVIDNSLFARNGAPRGAQVMEISSVGGVTLLHNTIVSTTISPGAAVFISGTVNLTNTIVASFTTGITVTNGGTLHENFNLFESVTNPTFGTTVSGGSSFEGDAAFVDPANDDYRLSSDSYAIDSGTLSYLTDDFHGDPRPQQLAPDIGYDETSFTGATFSIDDAIVNEGISGTTFLTMTVNLSALRGLTTSVAYDISDDTAIAGSDYTAPASGVLTFSPYITVGYIVINVFGDLTVELNETVTVTLHDSQVAGIADSIGVATIKNDDATQLAVSDSTINEGDSGTTNQVFSVTLTHPSELPVKVNYASNSAVGSNAALAGVDYISISGTLTFTAMQTTQWITVSILGDVIVEANELFRMTLSAPISATISDSLGIGTITNDDTTEVYIGDKSVSEGNSGIVNATFFVSLTKPSSLPITVTVTTSDTSAISTTDYLSTSSTIVFSSLQISKSLTVSVNGDTLVEGDELFSVNLSNPKNVTIGDGQGIGLIINDDATALSVGDSTVTEGDSGTGSTSFNITLTQPSSFPVTITYATVNNTAIASFDYQEISGTTTFAPEQTLLTVTVPVNGDIVVETNESFSVVLNSADGASITRGSGVGTISNDDATEISISDVTVSEGNSGTISAVFTLTLSNPSELPVTVEFETGGGSANPGYDYAITNGLIAFNAFETSLPITVEVIGDILVENDEIFNVELFNASGASILDETGVATIVNEDTTELSISDLSTVEGDSGVTSALLTVTLSNPSALTVTVEYVTSDNSAIVGNDYQPTTGTITFAPAQTTNWAAVPILGERLVEADETLTVTLSNSIGATLVDAVAVSTISNDDHAQLSISDTSVFEGNSGSQTLVFTVTLDRPSTFPATVSYASQDGSATAGDDYQTSTGMLNFAPLQTTQSVSVTVSGDLVVENHENLSILLSNASGATIADDIALGTIVDDDGTIVSIGNTSVVEGDNGVTPAILTITLSAPSALPVTVTYNIGDAGATAGLDYQSVNSAVTFAPLQVVQQIALAVNSDMIVEDNEDVRVTLLAATGESVIATEGGVGLATIINDDATTLSVSDISVNEADSGFTLAVFVVTLSNPSALPVSTDFETVGGTAIDGVDYAGSTGTIAFAPLQTTKSITIPVASDTIGESNESFILRIKNPLGATLRDGEGTCTIVDNDSGPTASISDTSVVEGNSGVVNAIFTVTLSAPSAVPVRLNYVTGAGVAASGEDFQNMSGVVEFAPQQTVQTIRIPVNGDLFVETDETFSVTITALEAVGGITDATGIATIVNDDSVTPTKFSAFLPLVTR